MCANLQWNVPVYWNFLKVLLTIIYFKLAINFSTSLANIYLGAVMEPLKINILPQPTIFPAHPLLSILVSNTPQKA
jgi:hypothetical protein